MQSEQPTWYKHKEKQQEQVKKSKVNKQGNLRGDR
jgi:hypothetical protein